MGDRHVQLKALILLGKERGYLTYSDLNQYLPNDMLDPEQINEIASMIQDMDIAVYDEAPKPETLVVSKLPVGEVGAVLSMHMREAANETTDGDINRDD